MTDVQIIHDRPLPPGLVVNLYCRSFETPPCSLQNIGKLLGELFCLCALRCMFKLPCRGAVLCLYVYIRCMLSSCTPTSVSLAMCSCQGPQLTEVQMDEHVQNFTVTSDDPLQGRICSCLPGSHFIPSDCMGASHRRRDACRIRGCLTRSAWN